MPGINLKNDTSTEKWYTRLSDIKSELSLRKSDIILNAKIDAFWGCQKPIFFDPDKNYGIFTRSIFSPNNEIGYFLDLCSLLNLEPLLLEYPDGKFVARNTEKYRLAKIKFFEGLGRNHGIKFSQISLVNFNTEEGKKMIDVDTVFNIKLIDVHHKALYKIYPAVEGKIHDFSDWFNKTRNTNGSYYFSFLSLFLKNAVLFENFIESDNEESKFTRNLFLPSFEKVISYFKVKPLIYPLLPIENEKNDSWTSYATNTKKVFSDIINEQA